MLLALIKYCCVCIC